MPSGWTRWLLEQFEFPFEVVYPKTLDAGNLASEFDVSSFRRASGRRPAAVVAAAAPVAAAADVAAAARSSIPAEYQRMLGAYTAGADRARSCSSFVEEGGTILAVGRSAMNLAQLLDLPLSNHLVERSPDGAARPLPSEKFYVPGSILRVAVDNTAPIAHGLRQPRSTCSSTTAPSSARARRRR